MADSVITLLVQHLSQLLLDHVHLRSGVKAKIKSLCNELEFIDVFLKSSEGKRNHESVEVLVKQIRDVAYKAEDVIDTYVANVSLQRNRNIVKRLLHFTGHEMMLRDVDAEIENIKSSIDEIYKNKDRYGIGEGEFQSRGDVEKETIESLHKRRRDVEEEEVVGLVHDSSIVIEHLLGADPRLNVVSILGMGGLGKTTLARKIYNKDEVKGTFSCRAWGYVSNDYRARELLLSFLQCLKSSTLDCKDLSEEELKEKVKESLKGNKYLVVLDDIWKTEVWDEVKGAFPDDRNGSKILITSRIKEVASYTRTILAYDLPLLDKEDSWQLFCKKVFGEVKCPSELESLGRTLIESCKGLPLAIVVLAGLISKKDKSPREWLRFIDNIPWHLVQDKTVLDTLKLSYDCLPRELKPCFLYLGIYPEDYEIHTRGLIELWIAKGFIQTRETGTSNAPPELEDIADYYLDDLVDRSLLQVAQRRSDRGVKTCRIHDLLRDLCISESKETKFMEVRTEFDIDELNPRRLSVHYKRQSSPSKYDRSYTRSLFLIGEQLNRTNGPKVCKWITESFKLARVLYLKCDFYLSLPSSDLKRMIHLKYVKIEIPYTISDTLIASICTLWNLETLHVKCTPRFIFPSTIWKLKRLRHVHAGEYMTILTSRAHSEIMWNLQSLGDVDLSLGIVSMLNNGCFPNLKKFCFRYNSLNCQPREELRNLHPLSKLRTLKVRGTSDLPLEANAFPLTLTKITLCILDYYYESERNSEDCELKLGTMKTLGQLPNLQILKLFQGWFAGTLNVTNGEFPQLQEFHMKEITIKDWRLEKGAMPRLRNLVIHSNYALKKLPEELWSMTTLQHVHRRYTSSELRRRLEHVEVMNGCKLVISH